MDLEESICAIGWEGGQCDACAEGFIGPACAECAPLYAGPLCQRCPKCQNGGKCRDGTEGDGNCLCSLGFYGEDCSYRFSPLNLLVNDKWTQLNDKCKIEISSTGENPIFSCNLHEGEQEDRPAFLQIIVFLQKDEPQPLLLSGYSKAEGVVGQKGQGYSLYMDATYHDGTKQFGIFLPFETGTHGWQYSEVRTCVRKDTYLPNFSDNLHSFQSS